ncbi:hypothetical protein U3516DRAFT_738367 [Neocallimastix sp. 'constans']
MQPGEKQLGEMQLGEMQHFNTTPLYYSIKDKTYGTKTLPPSPQLPFKIY